MQSVNSEGNSFAGNQYIVHDSPFLLKSVGLVTMVTVAWRHVGTAFTTPHVTMSTEAVV